jgi:arginase
MRTSNSQISLIGAPTDIGAGARGASMGPEALRVAGIAEALHGHGLEVLDRGNLIGPANPWLPPDEGYRHLDQVVAWNQIVHDAVFAELQGGRLPVLLTPSGNIHGMPVACLCGYGPQELIQIGGTVPAISPKVVRQIGIRSVDPGEKKFVHEVGMEVFDMRYIDEMGMRHTMELALATLDANTHLHVSFDVDFLDPPIAPGVGTTIPGGPTYREAQLCMEMIADTDRLASLDVMELNPALDVRNQTAQLAVDLIESLFGKSTLMRK